MARILVLDDKAIYREPIAAALRVRGYEVSEASTPEEALGLLDRESFDLILLELSLPRLDGLTLLKTVRTRPSLNGLPVMVLTVLSDRQSVLGAASLGVRHFLLKAQFSLETLYARVELALSGAGVPMPEPEPVAAAKPVEQSKPALGGGGVTEQRSQEALVELKQREALVSRATTVERLEECLDLKALSPAVAKVLKLTGGDSATMAQVATALKQDHSLALRVLKLANSSLYSRGEPVETMNKAVLRIGMGQIRQAMLNIGIIEGFAGEEFDGAVDMGLFWEHSIGCGMIASAVAALRSEQDAELAFTMGLVHDVGRLLMLKAFPEEYREVMATAEELGLPVELAEQRMLGINHADCMKPLLRHWRFPPALMEPVSSHHLSVDAARQVLPDRLLEYCTVALADRLAHALLLGDSGNPTLRPTEELCAALNLPKEMLKGLADRVVEETLNVKLAMLSQISGSAWSDAKSAVRTMLARPIRARYLSARVEFDAIAMFFDRLSDESAPFNLAVVHVTKAAEVNALASSLSRADEQSGRRLPLLVISSGGSHRMPQASLVDRPCGVMPSPVRIESLIKQINVLSASGTERSAAAA